MNDLDKLYSPSYWSKRFPSPEEVIKNHIEFIDNASIRTIRHVQCELNIPYGDTDRQKIDILGTDLSKDAPILIFIHGGYWQESTITRASYHFIASPLHLRAIKSVFIGYDLCPNVTLPQIVNQVKSAAKFCLQYAKQNKSKGVYLMGHSAGAHLATFLFNSLPEEDRFVVKGVILTSGVFDLSLVQKTVINESLKLDEGVAEEMSPLKRRVSAGTAFYVAVGEDESPEFIRQSEEFSEKLKKSGVETEYVLVKGVDHFDIMERMADEDYEMTKRLVEIITS